MFFTFILIVSIISVSAGIADWFKFGKDTDLEGELPSEADVSITMANTPPTIDSWTEPDDDTGTGGIQAWIPTACNNPTATNVKREAGKEVVVVTISDPNGQGDLDSGTVDQVDITVSKGAVTRD